MGALCICSHVVCSTWFIMIFPVQIVWWELMLASRLFVHAKPKLVSILLCSTCDGFSVVWLALAMQTLKAS